MYKIEKMTQDIAFHTADDWKYPNEYSFYDMTEDPEDYAEIVSEDLSAHLKMIYHRGKKLYGKEINDVIYKEIIGKALSAYKLGEKIYLNDDKSADEFVNYMLGKIVIH